MFVLKGRYNIVMILLTIGIVSIVGILSCADDTAPIYIDICECDTSIYRDCYCDSTQDLRPEPCLCDTTDLRDCYCDTLDPKPSCPCDVSNWRDCDCDTWDLPLDCDCDTSKYHDCWCDAYQPDTCWCDSTPYRDCECDYFQPDNPGVISYQDKIQPILDNYCVSCHNDNDPYADLTYEYSYLYMVDYVVTGNPEASELYQRIVGDWNIMPPSEPFLDQSEINLIYHWILQGAKNN
ncbi:MAG: hypothetical protein MI922_02385 [Bacteroidales bacterium]|nr:hypothetical protein [Bacteroidales bacterium]